jgi:hypothetical protein
MEEKDIKLWNRIQRGMEDGFDAAMSAVHTITAKAGEGIELTRLRREKARLETQTTRRLAELGNAVFEKISEQQLDDISEKLEIKDMVLEIAQDEARMVDIDRRLKKEKEEKMVEDRSGKDRRANLDRRKGGDSEHIDSERRETGNRRLDIERRNNDE